MPPFPEITIPAHQANQLKSYKAMDAAVLIIFSLKNGKDFPTFFSLIKAGLGPSCVKKEVMPNCCRTSDGRSPAQIHAKGFYQLSSPVDYSVMGDL